MRERNWRSRGKSDDIMWRQEREAREEDRAGGGEAVEGEGPYRTRLASQRQPSSAGESSLGNTNKHPPHKGETAGREIQGQVNRWSRLWDKLISWPSPHCECVRRESVWLSGELVQMLRCLFCRLSNLYSYLNLMLAWSGTTFVAHYCYYTVKGIG